MSSQPEKNRKDERPWLETLFPDSWEWLREAFRQLALVAQWRNVQNQVAQDELKQEIEDQVLTPFLEVEWLSGVRSACKALDSEDKPTHATVLDATRALAHWFVSRWPGEPGQTVTEEDVIKALQLGLQDAVEHKWSEPEEPSTLHLPVCGEYDWKGPPALQWQRAWLGQALALHAWRELEPRVMSAVGDGWRQKCEQLLALIAKRNETGSGKLWRFLVKVQSLGDYQLFQHIAVGLAQGMDKTDPPLSLWKKKVRILDQPLPGDWPPLLLVQHVGLPVLKRLRDRLRDGQPGKANGNAALPARAALIAHLLATDKEEWKQFTEKLIQDRNLEAEQAEQLNRLGVLRTTQGRSTAGSREKGGPAVREAAGTGSRAEKPGPSVEQMLQTAMTKDPEGWEPWPEGASAVTRLLAAADSKDALNLLTWFERFYKRFHDDRFHNDKHNPARECYRRLALLLKDHLARAKLLLVWAVERWGLTEQLGVQEDAYPAEWIVGVIHSEEHAPGAVLRVEGFGNQTDPPKLKVNLGIAPTEKVRTWLNTPAGQGWFNRLCREAREKPRRSAWRTLHRLCQQSGCGCYPAIDLESNPPVPSWPRNAPLSGKNVHVKPGPDIGGQPLEHGLSLPVDDTSAIEYAPVPEDARCTVILGAELPDLAAARRVYVLLDNWRGTKDKLIDGFQQFLKACACANTGELWQPEQFEPHLKPLLDVLAEATRQPDQRQALAEVLSSVQACLACPPWKVDLVPHTLDCIGKKWNEDPVKWDIKGVPGGKESWGNVLCVERFGLVYGGVPHRKAVLEVGVGPALDGWSALDDVYKDNGWGEHGRLRQQLDCCLKGRLRDEQTFMDGLCQFYREFCDAKHAGLPADLTAQIEPALDKVRTALELQEYEPKPNLKDYQGSYKDEVELDGEREIGRDQLKQTLRKGWRKTGQVKPLVKAKARYGPN